MPFVKDDPRINRVGRPTLEDEVKLTKKQLRSKELIMLLRKLRPHVATAVLTACEIMEDKNAGEANRLKASTIVIDNYRKMVLDLYGATEDEDEQEAIQQGNPAARFSLTVVKDKK